MSAGHIKSLAFSAYGDKRERERERGGGERERESESERERGQCRGLIVLS